MRPPISDIRRHPLAASLIPFDQTVMREARSLKALERYGIEAMPTSAFLTELLREDRTSATKALVAMASRHRNPPRNLPELAAFADSLERSVAERYEDEARRMFRPPSSWTRGHDTRGRFTRKPYTDPGDVMPSNGSGVGTATVPPSGSRTCSHVPDAYDGAWEHTSITGT